MSSFNNRANSVAAISGRMNDVDDEDEEEESIEKDFELSFDPLISGPKYVQKQILQRKFSFYVIDTIVPLNGGGSSRHAQASSVSSTGAALSTLSADQEHQHFVQYSVSSNINYIDHRNNLTRHHNFQKIQSASEM